MSEKAVVQLDNVYLTSDRGETIFRNLDFRLDSSQSAVVVGPAGSGKTCLIELLVGRRSADEGSVEVFGYNVRPRYRRRLCRIRRKIGGVGGIYSLVPSYTVAQNVAFPLVLNGERRRVRRERLMKTLAEFSLLKQAGEYPVDLTRVEYTMAQFARAAIANQPLLLVDEPLAGLDAKTYDRLFEYLLKVSASGRSMIIVTSDQPARELPNSKVYQISEGRLQ